MVFMEKELIIKTEQSSRCCFACVHSPIFLKKLGLDLDSFFTQFYTDCHQYRNEYIKLSLGILIASDHDRVNVVVRILFQFISMMIGCSHACVCDMCFP